MKIVFDTNTWEEPKSFEIKYFSCEYDENMRPIDIVIGADKETLESISEFSRIGWNICENDGSGYLPFSCSYQMCTHSALYARLVPFKIIKENMHKIIYY